MRLFRTSERIGTQGSILKRGLHKFNTLRTELVIGNNSAIFATLSGLILDGKKNHPEVKLVCPPNWLDLVHDDYSSEDWGQTIYGLPKVARDLFLKEFPAYKDDEFVKWHQVLQIRMKALEILDEVYGIPIYFGEPSLSVRSDGDFSISVTNNQNKETIPLPSNTHFYSWYRVPAEHDYQGVVQRQSTDIYRVPRHLLPDDVNIISLGAGLSTVWLAKHFMTPSRKLICLKHKDDKLITDVPSNAGVKYDDIIVMNIEDVEVKPIIIPSDSHPNKKSEAVQIKHEGNVYSGLFFSSIGYRPANWPGLSLIPNSQLTSIHTPEQKWVAPKNVPPGSLMQSLILWYQQTNKMEWFFEPQSYYDVGFPTLMKNKISVPLTPKYFNKLEEKALSFDNPVGDELEKKLLIDIYCETMEPTRGEIERFEQDLHKLFSTRASLDSPNF